MSRPLRIEGEHLCYHVYNRGNNKQKIFYTDDDYFLFLDHLFTYAEKFDVEIYAFCLMPNHFHIFLITHLPNLSSFMESFQAAFVRQYNRFHDRVGHVFQDRYKAQVVDTEYYDRQLSRYIHLNPIRTSAMLDKSEQEQLKTAFEYPWSSIKAYCEGSSCPWPVNTSMLLSGFGDSQLEQYRHYTQYIKEGISTDTNIFDNVIAGSILGSESFLKSLLNSSHISMLPDTSTRPARKRITSCTLSEVITAVCNEYAVKATEILPSRVTKPFREARKVLLWAAATSCIARLSMQEIGRRCGGINGASVNHAKRNVNQQRKNNRMLFKHTQAIINRLNCSFSDPWMEMYTRLTAYHKKFKHCLVPENYTPDICLGVWVKQQRLVRKGKAHNSSPLTVEQIELLDKLNFSWRM